MTIFKALSILAVMAMTFSLPSAASARTHWMMGGVVYSDTCVAPNGACFTS